MQSTATQDLNQELDLLFQYNPPPRSVDPKCAHLCPELTPPLLFYDKHLATNLSLKKVEIIPLATYLSHAVDRTIQSLQDKNMSIPSQQPGSRFPSREHRAAWEYRDSIIDADTLVRAYQETTARYSRIVASTLLLHIHAPCWVSALNWNVVEYGDPERYQAFNQAYALYIHNLDGTSPYVSVQAREPVDEETRATLQRVNKRYRGLAYWGVFAISDDAEEVLEQMGASTGHYNYGICQTKGYSTPPIATTGSPDDAPVTGWGVPVASLSTALVRQVTSGITEPPRPRKTPMLDKKQSLRRSTRAHPYEAAAKKAKDLSMSRKGSVEQPINDSFSRPSVTTPRWKGASSMANMFLQRAWAGAVERDSTYVILNCGDRERIGFRHRSSQTLFLSDLIDIPHCRDPGYGKIHIGLYLSILQDVIDRTEQQCKQDEMFASNNRKRRRGSIDLTPNKRYKTRGAVRRERNAAEERRKNHDIVKKEADRRPLLLLELRYGIYNSPAPASFLRLQHINKCSYSPQEYFSIVVTSKIAEGATGVAHGGYLELQASDGTLTRRTDVVVKFAFKPEQIKRMRHEFSIYEHLASCGVVEGIPIVYGLFEDTETDVLALVMSNVGTSLVTLLPDESSYGVTISETVKAAYLRVLRTIHEAGVQHHDLRPNNLCLSDDDEVAIIDFDLAELDPSKGAKRDEMFDMACLLQCPPNEFPSGATTPEKHPTPMNYWIFTPETRSSGQKQRDAMLKEERNAATEALIASIFGDDDDDDE